MDTSTWLPVKLVYELNGESVAIDISGMAAVSGGVAGFDQSAYEGYEIIDFR